MKRGREEEEFDKKDIHRFVRACERGDMAMVQDYMKRGIDVNAECAGLLFNTTALHRAARKGHVDVAKVLIQNGADVNAVDKDQETPLHCAALNGHVDVAKVLIQNGVDVNAVNKEKETPLHYAAFKGRADVAKVLIQNGADVNAVNTIDRTALHEAAEYGHVDVANVLIQNGADVNAVGYRNETVIDWAASNGHAVFVLQLLCFGSAIDENSFEDDETDLLGPINDRMKLLRAGKRPDTSLMSNEERRFMWNLAFSLTIQHPAAAFKAYYTIRSFITFHGIFMADGYDLGEESIWKRAIEEEDCVW